MVPQGPFHAVTLQKYFMHMRVKEIKLVNDEEQLLRIFRSLFFEIKCNNDKKDLFDFYYQ